MSAVRGRITRDQRPDVVVSEPIRQTPLQDALPAAPNTRDHDDGAVTASVRGAQEALERRAAAILCVAVQIERRADLKLATTDPLFIAAMLRRRCGLGACGRRRRNRLWRSRLRNAFSRLPFLDLFDVGRNGTACLHACGDASPQLLFVGSEVALLFAHAA